MVALAREQHRRVRIGGHVQLRRAAALSTPVLAFLVPERALQRVGTVCASVARSALARRVLAFSDVAATVAAGAERLQAATTPSSAAQQRQPDTDRLCGPPQPERPSVGVGELD